MKRNGNGRCGTFARRKNEGGGDKGADAWDAVRGKMHAFNRMNALRKRKENRRKTVPGASHHESGGRFVRKKCEGVPGTEKERRKNPADAAGAQRRKGPSCPRRERGKEAPGPQRTADPADVLPSEKRAGTQGRHARERNVSVRLFMSESLKKEGESDTLSRKCKSGRRLWNRDDEGTEACSPCPAIQEADEASRPDVVDDGTFVFSACHGGTREVHEGVSLGGRNDKEIST